MNDYILLDKPYKLYPSRFLVVGLFALIQLMSSCLLNTLTPIAADLAIIYNESSVVATLGGLLFVIMHPIFTFPATYMIDTYGTRSSIAIGCLLGIIGVSLRLFVNHSFAWIIIGQVIAGIGRPFILNCQAKISANWFSAEKRGQVTQLLTLIVNVSLIIGLVIPSVIFGRYDPTK